MDSMKLIVGPQIFSPAYFFGMLFMGGVMHTFGAYDASASLVIERVVSVSIAHLPMMLVIYSAIKLSSRFGTFNKYLFVVVGFYAAGATRGYFLQNLLISFDASIFTDYGFRVYGSALNTLILGFVLSYAMGMRRQWIENFANLRTAQKKLEQLLSQTENEIENITNEDITSIKSQLVDRISTLTKEDPSQISVMVKNVIDTNLRPLITRYLHPVEDSKGFTTEPLQFKFNWLDVARFITVRSAINPVAIATPIFLLNIPSFARYLGESRTIFTLSIMALSLILLMLLARFVVEKTLIRMSVWVRISGILFVSFVFTIPVALIFWYLTIDVPVIHRVPLELPGIVVSEVLFLGVWGAAQSELTEMEAKTIDYNRQIRWKISELNGRLWHHRRKFARLLHGPIQAELAAFAIRIDLKETSNVSKGLSGAEIEDLASRVNVLLENEAPIPQLESVMNDISETWAGICEIKFVVSQQASMSLATDPLCHEVVVETIREICSNAIRHGGATHIMVQVDRITSDLVELRISNNGTLGDKSTTKAVGSGVGSLYIDECTFSNTLISQKSGVISRSLVPLRNV